MYLFVHVLDLAQSTPVVSIKSKYWDNLENFS